VGILVGSCPPLKVQQDQSVPFDCTHLLNPSLIKAYAVSLLYRFCQFPCSLDDASRYIFVSPNKLGRSQLWEPSFCLPLLSKNTVTNPVDQTTKLQDYIVCISKKANPHPRSINPSPHSSGRKSPSCSAPLLPRLGHCLTSWDRLLHLRLRPLIKNATTIVPGLLGVAPRACSQNLQHQLLPSILEADINPLLALRTLLQRCLAPACREISSRNSTFTKLSDWLTMHSWNKKKALAVMSRMPVSS
jgi:hypothetical protein